MDGSGRPRASRSRVDPRDRDSVPHLNFTRAADWVITFSATVRRKNKRASVDGRATMGASLSNAAASPHSSHAGTRLVSPIWRRRRRPSRTREHATTTIPVWRDTSFINSHRLRANLTVNTDFAQAEVDQRQRTSRASRCSFPQTRFFPDGSLFSICRRRRRRFGGGGGGATSTDAVLSPAWPDARNDRSPHFCGKLTGQAGAFVCRLAQSSPEDGPPSAGLHGLLLTSTLRPSRWARSSAAGGAWRRLDYRHNRRSVFSVATSSFRAPTTWTATAFFPQDSQSGAPGATRRSACPIPNDPFSAQMEFREVQRTTIGGGSRACGSANTIRGSRFPPRPRRIVESRQFHFRASTICSRSDHNRPRRLARSHVAGGRDPSQYSSRSG